MTNEYVGRTERMHLAYLENYIEQIPYDENYVRNNFQSKKIETFDNEYNYRLSRFESYKKTVNYAGCSYLFRDDPKGKLLCGMSMEYKDTIEAYISKVNEYEAHFNEIYQIPEYIKAHKLVSESLQTNIN